MPSHLFRVAIVGATSLKGRELMEVLEARNFPAADVRLLDEEEAQGRLESVGDEATLVQSVTAGSFQNADFAFFACDEQYTRKHWKLAEKAGSTVVDLSYALETTPGAGIRAPWVERELESRGVPASAPDLGASLVVVAHPAATVLALLVLRAQRAAKLDRVVASVFEPVSERGRAGMDELHQQTVNLFAFHPLPMGVFDEQVAFNMLAQYGAKSPASLASAEQRVVRHLQHLLGKHAPVPSLVLAHAPMFHGHLFSVYMEFASELSEIEVCRALAGEHVELARTNGEQQTPSNVSVAGQDSILLGVRRDAVRSHAFWLWAAADNLKLAAITAVDCAAALALTRSRGAVQ